MNIALPLVFLTLFAGCANNHSVSVASPIPPDTTAEHAAPVAQTQQFDPIDALVARLSSTHGLWIDGLFPKIDPPATASVQQVVGQVFQRTGFDKGHVTTHRIIETRHVRIDSGFPDPVYTAVLVETDFGRKIVLLRHTTSSGWWTRVYDA